MYHLRLPELLEQRAASQPERCALVSRGQRLSYGELNQQAEGLARGLVSLGVAPADRVMIVSDNSPEVVVAFWAALKARAAPCIINPQTKPDKLRYYLRDSRPKVVVSDGALAATLAAAHDALSGATPVIVTGLMPSLAPPWQPLTWSAALQPSAPALVPGGIDLELATLVYTSGSTGPPKGVMLTHRNMLGASAGLVALFALQPEDVIVSALPLSFNYGMYQMILAARAGATLVLEKNFSFPAQVLSAMERERATVFPGVPTMFALLAELKQADDFNTSSVRLITNTAASLTASHLGMFERVFPQAQVLSMFGLTECKRCTYLPPEMLRQKPESVGIAMPNVELWLEDDHGARLPAGQVGELVVRSSHIMRGYWEKPEATAAVLKPGPIPGELVFYTGDLCRFDGEGYLYFVARKDDLIKSRGEKVAPAEVEAALLALDGVKEAAVIGVPDPVLGQAVKAFVVLTDGVPFDEKALLRECAKRLEAYMLPRWIVAVAALPRTETGKLTKLGLS